MVVGESSQPPVKDTTLTFQYPGVSDAMKNNIMKGFLFQSIPKDLVLQIRNLKIGKEMWEAIKIRNLGTDRVKEARLQTLITEFGNLKMSDNDSIEAYMPRSCQDVVGRLKAYEERVNQEDKANDSQEKLLYAKTNNSNRNSDSSRGRGRGSYSRGRGRGRDQKRDYEANLSETHEGDVNHEEGTFFVMNHIQETIFMNEEKYTPPKSESNTDEDDVWYFDNGGNHMIGKNGEQKLLKDIYYITALHSNVISLGQATISGCDIRIRGVTPYEKFYGEKLNLEDLKVFRCVAYERIVSKHLKKLDDRSKPLVYLGKEPSSAGFRLYNPRENKIIISAYVICDEKRGAEFQQPVNENTTNRPAVEEQPTHDSPRHTSTVHVTISSTVHDTVPSIVHATVPRQNTHQVTVHSPQTPTDEDDYEDDDIAILIRRSTRNKVLPTRKYNEAKLKPRWLKAMKTELDSIVKNNTWKLVPLSKGVVPIGLKWLFKIKRNIDGSIMKYKVLLVAKGDVQQPEIDFDEVFASVARVETIRLLIDLAAGKGWKIHHLEEEKVYKLAKSLYGLRQALRAWNTKLDNSLKEMDDLFMTGTSLGCINKFKKKMASQFEMSDLGELTYYLGIKVSQGKDCVEIKQERYERKILKESVLGFLRYLLHSRPDLTYSVGVVTRYMQSPRESHARAIKQILRYLKGTTSFGIKYNHSNDMKLVRYSDSSHNVDIDDERSTTGHVFYLGTSPITWCSQKQTTVALSSCEAEFMAANAAACQAI
ncbi:ribonuclease H-like domain, reverse transcriptase, RNA-dependent DNA polymerase [Tanacetum coccineum]|uniref:Ribonuclease H-like domain, reverse transcriptase, RNA-dependent DNA polymerase n=1 Tax=Tanacetum coccineum TaxID=301880 RepID=A0ABQ5BJ87_9ASTR